MNNTVEVIFNNIQWIVGTAIAIVGSIIVPIVLRKKKKDKKSETKILIKMKFDPAWGHFIGREHEINEIHTRLKNSSYLILTGTPGIGKTELAKAYACKYQNEYDVIWLGEYNSNGIMGIVSSFLFDNSANSEQKKELLGFSESDKLRELQKYNEKTLIIVDNFDSDQQEAHYDVFVNGPYKVLFTTRITQTANCLEIKEISEKTELIKLFKTYYKPQEIRDNEFDDVWHLISDFAEGNTFVVEMIAATMRDNRIYAKEMRKKLSDGITSEVNYSVTINKQEYSTTTKTKRFSNHLNALFDLSKITDSVEFGEDALLILQNLTLIPSSGIEIEQFYNWALKQSVGKDRYRYVLNKLIARRWVRENITDRKIFLQPMISQLVSSMPTFDGDSRKQLIDSIIFHANNSNNMTNFELHECLIYLDIALKNMVNSNSKRDLELRRCKTSIIIQLYGNYPIVFAFDSDMNGWACFIPDCIIFVEGKTKEDCLKGIQELLYHYVELATKYNTPIPEPSQVSLVKAKWPDYEALLLFEALDNSQ